jgi:hypothetical protein
MIHKEPSPQKGHVRVTFEIPASAWADHIYLVGDFNDWDRRSLPLQRARNGIWRIILDLPAHRRYEFRYLMDDRWCSDIHADGCVQCGAPNSFVDTTPPLESLAEAAGHSLVREAAFEKGMDFAAKPHA